MFDAILNLEQEYIDDGIAQALIDTVQTSFDEGQDIGFARGLEIGQELAYIQSIAHYLQSKSVTERSTKLIQELISALDAFPSDNSKDIDIIAHLYRIRGKFRVAKLSMKSGHLYSFKQDREVMFLGPSIPTLNF